MKIYKLFFTLFLFCASLNGSSHASSCDYLEDYFKEKARSQPVELKGGLSGAKNYKVEVENSAYVLRILNPNESLVSREREIQAATCAATIKIAPRVFYHDPQYNAMIMEFIDGPTLTSSLLQDSQNLKTLLKTVKKLHTFEGNFPQGDTIFAKIKAQLTKLKASSIPTPEKAIEEAERKLSVIEEQFKHEPLVPCHNDLSALNILMRAGEFRIIDWTDCGKGHAYNDLGYFALVNSIEKSRYPEMLSFYLNRKPTFKELEKLSLMITVNKLRIFASNFPAYEPKQDNPDTRKMRRLELEEMLKSHTLHSLEHFFQMHREGKLSGKEAVIALSLSALREFLNEDVACY